MSDVSTQSRRSLFIACLAVAGLVVLAMSCTKTLPTEPESQQSAQVITTQASSEATQVGQLEDGEVTCRYDDDCGPAGCSGTEVTLTLNATGSSTRSAANCEFVIDAIPQNHCQTNNLPSDCSGTCATGSCKPYGEATNTTITKHGPPLWECEATEGRCFCKCY